MRPRKPGKQKSPRTEFWQKLTSYTPRAGSPHGTAALGQMARLPESYSDAPHTQENTAARARRGLLEPDLHGNSSYINNMDQVAVDGPPDLFETSNNRPPPAKVNWPVLPFRKG
jgi:hypothetical protein